MLLMSLRSRSHVKASMVLTRADQLIIYNYIRSLLNIILRSILMVWTILEQATRVPCPKHYMSDTLANYIYIYIYIYIYVDN